MNIKEQVLKLKDTIKEYPNTQIIAATKYMDIEQTRELLDCGITDIGENRTDMLLEKYAALNGYKHVNWHFFGVLQSRKIKDVVNKITCLHSLDKLSLAIELNKRLLTPLDCFIQINISEEQNKQGIAANKLKSFVKSLEKCDKIRIVGIMCIAKLTFDDNVLEKSFSKMQKLQQEIIEMNLSYAPCRYLSMGMSNDYLIALKYGATHIRIGRLFLS